MTANQRRPGFRLPWSSEEESAASTEAPAPEAATPSPETAAPDVTAQPGSTEAAPTSAGDASDAAPAASAGASEPKPESAAAAPAAGDSAATEAPAGEGSPVDTPPVSEPAASEFLRDLVAAMRRVAEEARQAEIATLHQRSDEQVARLESSVESRREELRKRAEEDIAGVGEWARAEAERIKAEAEQRVAARRAQLDRQLAAEGARGEAEVNALRQRVAEYERELDAFHAQLAEITDPAAFAAAAKRVPQPPSLDHRNAGSGTAPPPPAESAGNPGGAEAATAAPAGSTDTASAPTNGVLASPTAIHPAEEEVLATRLAELDAELEQAAPVTGEAATTTEVVVKGLGSFGAITGFRQSLAGVEGVQGVALSLGHSGEFIFRATHAAGFDLVAAIRSLEGESAKIEPRPQGGLAVTLDRSR